MSRKTGAKTLSEVVVIIDAVLARAPLLGRERRELAGHSQQLPRKGAPDGRSATRESA